MNIKDKDTYFDETHEDLLIKEYLKLNPKLKEYSLSECLCTSSLFEILRYFDSNSSVTIVCEEFGVNDVNNFKSYENLAKNSNCFLEKLLRDYAIRNENIEGKVNTSILRNLEDLQHKLWQLKDGKLACKQIKLKENDILEECFKNKNNDTTNNLILGMSVFSPEEEHRVKSKNYDFKVMIKMPDSGSNSSTRKSVSDYSSSSSSSVTSNEGYIVDYNNNNNNSKISTKPLRNLNLPKNTRKVKVNLYYHPYQDKFRIENFMREVILINPNIELRDVSSESIENLEAHIENDIPFFIFFDKQTEKIISNQNDNFTTDAKCSAVVSKTVKQFYSLLYRKFLNFSIEKYFIFIMEDYNEFEATNSWSWLLKYKLKKFTSKKIYIKPYLIPKPNSVLSPYLEYFLLNFNYPNYLFNEYQTRHF